MRDDRDGAAPLGVGQEIETVALVAGDGEKEEPRPDRAAVGAEARDLQAAQRGREIRAGQELLEAHQCAPAALGLALATLGVSEQL